MNSEKKRRFNVVDVIIIVALIAVIIFVCYKYVFRGEAASTPTAEITYRLQVENIDAETVECIQIFELPLQLVSGDVYISDAYVIDVEFSESENHIEYYTNPDGTIGSRILTGKYDAILTVKATVNDVANVELGTQEIRAGKSNHYIKTKYYELAGTILSVDWAE